MSFLNPALLVGLALALIPVALHLFLRAKPKRMIFPALRLIQQRRRQNVRRIKLRHFWLLLLRVGIIALIVLAICRPSLPAANYSLNVREWLTLIAIAALAIGAYFGLMQWWKRQSLARSTLLTRRSVLRGALGAAAVLLALTAVAWPYASRVTADIKNPAPRVAENVPVAAVFLFDTSVSMSYKQANKTRLRSAQDVAKAHVTHLPSGSKIAVAASGDGTPAAFSTDLFAAQSRIDALDIKAVSAPLNNRLNALLQLQEDDRQRVSNEQSSVPAEQRQDRFVREIYLFTDLTKSAWRDEGRLKDELARLRWAGIYLIDVGEKAPVNAALTEVKLSREAVPARTAIRVDAVVSAVGSISPEQTVELYLKAGDGPPTRKGTESVKLESGRETRVSFYPVELPEQSFTHGELRLSGADPLSADDIVHFSVQTIPSLKVLVVAELPAISNYWTLALKNLTDAGVSAFQTENATPDQLVDRNLDDVDVVCLINASQPTDTMWNKLQTFVDRGGGLAVFLGASSSALAELPNKERINPVRYQSEAALSVLPAKPIAASKHLLPHMLDLRKSQHTLLKRLDDLGALTELGLAEVRRYWKVEPGQDSVVISRYIGNAEDDIAGSPALLERRIGQGRVLMLTTSVDAKSWNDFLSPELYVVIVDQFTQYLASQASAIFNYQVGDEVSLPLSRKQKITKVILRMPDFKQRVVDVPADARYISLRDATSTGSYSVDSADQTVDYHVGFSVNLPAAESDLTRLETSDLDTMLGEKRYRIADNPAELERISDQGRLGQEMYGMVVAFLVAVFALEQFTATWFYRTDES